MKLIAKQIITGTFTETKTGEKHTSYTLFALNGKGEIFRYVLAQKGWVSVPMGIIEDIQPTTHDKEGK